MNRVEKLREQILSQGPTDEQRKAIFAEEREFLLRASPGSGKTWTSCRRFIWRGASWDYKVGGLALLSFTNAAIREFHAATNKVGYPELLSDPNYVGTFDSFVERFILTPFGHLVTGLQKRPHLHISPRPTDWINRKLSVWVQLSGGRKCRIHAWDIIPFPNNGEVGFKTFLGNTLLFTEYNPVEELFKLGRYTHAQRVYLAWRILSTHPSITRCLARRFPEIIVDEAQDTNIWLLILLALLRKNGAKITLIGDPDQCIYEFSMADATSLTTLKTKWAISEKPLTKSFRCNTLIAEAVRNISGNNSFTGCGPGANEYHKPFIVREPSNKGFGYSISAFNRLLECSRIQLADSAIICRGNAQLESIRGEVNYGKLTGLTKKLAEASFYRDVRKDYGKAFQIVEGVAREIVDAPGVWEEIDEHPESNKSYSVRLSLWKFVRSPLGLPAVSENGDNWIIKLRESIANLLKEIGISAQVRIGQKIRRNGLTKNQLLLPLFKEQELFPAIRQETVHAVKGESISSVMLLGTANFFNSIVADIAAGRNTENRRLAYVGMTRARHALLVGLPASHFDKHLMVWKRWGFVVLS